MHDLVDQLSPSARALFRWLEGGLGHAHSLQGVAALSLPAPETSFSLHLRPGVVALSLGLAPDARGTLTFKPGAAEGLLATRGRFDLRDPAVLDALAFDAPDAATSDFLLDLLQCLLRPAAALQKQLAAYDARARQDPRLPRLTSAPRLPACSEGELAAHLEQGLPLVLTGALRHWPAFEQVVQSHGQVELRVPGRGLETLASFVARLARPDPGARYTYGSLLPPGLGDLYTIPYFADRASPRQLWMGAPRAPSTLVTPLHRDLAWGLLGQAHGHKRLRLFSPDQADRLYPRLGFGAYQPCWANPDAPDLALHPRLRDAHGIDVDLEPGDLFVQPPAWFHAVYTNSPLTASVSAFVQWP